MPNIRAGFITEEFSKPVGIILPVTEKRPIVLSGFFNIL